VTAARGRRPSATGLAVLATLYSACAPDRGRPGPPSVVIELRAGSTVYSPDSLPFSVTASDTDGLDSLTVNFLDSIAVVPTEYQNQVQRSFRWPVPSRLTTGRVLRLSARATDVRRLETVSTVEITVISRPTASR
jgi:hypothetical protein